MRAQRSACMWRILLHQGSPYKKLDTAPSEFPNELSCPLPQQHLAHLRSVYRTEVVFHKDVISVYVPSYLALPPPNGSSRTATLQGDVSVLEKQSQAHSSVSAVERVSYKVRFAHINERKVMNKIDLRVVPVLCLLYLLAFLDRVNISNAAIFGLKEELHLYGTDYNAALVIL